MLFRRKKVIGDRFKREKICSRRKGGKHKETEVLAQKK